jgi:peptidoglycan/xylan/chitin deacetylase (PgdA/CDA1 family)
MPALILMYHDLSGLGTDVPAGHRPYVVDVQTFRAQISLVAGACIPVRTVSQWCELRNGQPTIVLTFDDGHVSNYSIALPILVECGIKATFFITAGRVGTGDTMDWHQIRALHAMGMEIGSHTLTHRPPALLSDIELRHELVESRRLLEDGLGSPILSISSPTGFFNARMRAIAREAGYRSLCIGKVGVAHDQADTFSLNRVAVKRSISEHTFAALLKFDRLTLGRMRAAQSVRNLAKHTLGVESYLRVRRLLVSTRPA